MKISRLFQKTTLLKTTGLENNGLIESSSQVMRHRVKDGDSHYQDQCVSREVNFKNGLVLRQKGDRVLALQGGKLLVSTTGQLQIPTAADPTTVVRTGWTQEAISPDGAIQLRVQAGSGSPTGIIDLQDNHAHGERVDEVPVENSIFEGYEGDNDAAKAGIKGYWADDVGNHYYIHDVDTDLGPNGQIPGTSTPAFVTPHLLGDPQTAPMAAPHEGFYERYEFTPDNKVKFTGGDHNFLGMGEEEFYNKPLPKTITDRWPQSVRPPATQRPN